MIGRRQPEEQREQAGLDAKGCQKQHRQRGVEPRRPSLRPGAGQIRNVERARLAVEQSDGCQEEGRRQQVEPDVRERGVELSARAVQGHQDEGGDQHHLEPDVQVEDVAGQEGPRDPHQQHVYQRVVAERLAPRIDTGERRPVTATPMMPTITTMSALKRSATRVMPNGAGHEPICST